MQRSTKQTLSLLNRLLTFWIFLAMAIGVGIGAVYPEIAGILDALRIDSISLPIAIGINATAGRAPLCRKRGRQSGDRYL